MSDSGASKGDVSGYLLPFLIPLRLVYTDAKSLSHL